jgi:hypothetical protein
MSTPEQPATPPLTRKKMREIRNTGSTPIIDTTANNDTADGAEAPPTGGVTVNDAPAAVAAPPVIDHVPAPMPRAAVPVEVSPAPIADSSVDLGVSPLTRRQARQQERIRTASVPVITPDVANAQSAQPIMAPAPEPVPVAAGAQGAPEASVGFTSIFGTGATPVVDPEFAPEDFTTFTGEQEVTVENEGWRDTVLEASPETAALAGQILAAEAAEKEATAAGGADPEADAPRAVVNPMFGSHLLGQDTPQTEVPASFDQIFSRSTGVVSTSNALIMTDAPIATDFSGAVTSAGEIIVTGTIQLPEGLGSTGHALGTTDGKEVDAVLVDGELPAHSSPTPIAASAAISTVKQAGEVIKPPVPEKGGRLMMTLAITAGVLALALVGVLIVAFATGVFS